MTILVIGVVLALGIPNMTTFTGNSRITSTANDLHAAFQMARSEAARSKSNIVICASDNPFEDDANCGGTWADGFIVFQSTNPPNLVRDAANEPLLRASPAIATGVNLRIVDDAVYFMYSATGMGRQIIGESAVSQVFICDERGNAKGRADDSVARMFVATPLGRATVVRNLDIIEKALDETELACP